MGTPLARKTLAPPLILSTISRADVENRENHFCESYKQFFDYAVPRFMQIAAEIQNGSLKRHTRSAEGIRLHIEK